MTMEKNYEEAYKMLLADVQSYYSPTRDLTKYIDKMTMIGGKYKHLEKEIRQLLQSREYDKIMYELEEAYNTELSVLSYMVASTVDRLNTNAKLMQAVEEGDRDLKALLEDFAMIRLVVKGRAMGARAEMQELIARVDRQSRPILVEYM